MCAACEDKPAPENNTCAVCGCDSGSLPQGRDGEAGSVRSKAERRSEESASPNPSSSNPSPQEIEEVALLPCPFCGGEAELTGYKAPEFWVRCDKMGCKASTESFGSKDRAIAAWNTRPSHTEEIEALRGEVERLLDSNAKLHDIGQDFVSHMERLQSHNAKMREALTKCRDKFRFYADLHRLKCTADGDEKADRNAEMADMCDSTLSSLEGGGGRG